MSETGSSIAARFATLSAVLLVATGAFTLLAYSGDLVTVFSGISTVGWLAIYGVYVAVCLLLLASGGEVAVKTGATGLSALVFAVGLTAALKSPEYLAPLLERHLPTWPRLYWVLAGVGSAVGLFVLGLGVAAVREVRAS